MPSFVFHRVAPTEAELRAARDEVVTQGLRDLNRRGITLPAQFDGPEWGPLLEAAERPEGVWVHHWTVSWRHPPEVVIGAAWWTDPVGRRHWYIEEALADEHSRFYRLALGHLEQDLTAGRHPLEWLVPPSSCGYRERGGKRELVVVCGCGVAGPPAEVGWSGDCCGPCFDRKQDGEAVPDRAPARPGVGTVTRFGVAPDGTLVTTLGDPHQGLAGETTVRAWAPPWAGPARWARRVPHLLEGAPACGDGVVALRGGPGALLLLDLRTGSPVDARQGEAFADLQCLEFVRTTGALAGACLTWGDNGGLVVWPVGEGGRVGARLHRAPGVFTALGVQPGGVRVVAGGPGGALEVREAVSGGLIERLRAPMAGHVDAVMVAPDATVIAAARSLSGGDTVLARWGPAGGGGRGAGWLRWGAPERAPDRVVTVKGQAHSLALSPDGGVVAACLEPGGLAFWGAGGLEELARFWPPVGVVGPVAFAPDGEWLLVNTGAGLAVYPWRELVRARKGA